jgi:hypothetical protein
MIKFDGADGAHAPNKDPVETCFASKICLKSLVGVLAKIVSSS